MRNEWWAYVIVAVLSVVAGVAVAGLPNDVTVDATVVPPSSTVARNESPSEAPADTSNVTEPDGLPARADFAVVVADGAGDGGAVDRTVELLESIGYLGVESRNGTVVAQLTEVYFADGLEGAAIRLAADLGLPPERVAPLGDAPTADELPGDVDLLAYVGVDGA